MTGALLFLAIFAGTALGAADGIASMVRLNRVPTVLVACGAVMALIGLIQFAFSYDLTAVFTIPGLESKAEGVGVENAAAASAWPARRRITSSSRRCWPPSSRSGSIRRCLPPLDAGDA